MPLWSRDEIRAVVPAIYPPRRTPQTDDQGSVVLDATGQAVMVDLYEQRFDMYGGFARYVFAPMEDHDQGFGYRELEPAIILLIDCWRAPTSDTKRSYPAA